MLHPVIGGTVIFLFITYIVNNAYKKPNNFPPGPPSLPIYGAYWIVLYNSYNSLATAFQKLGEKYKTNIVGLYMGTIPTIVINDAKLIKQMLFTEAMDGRMDIIVGRVRSFWKKLGLFFTDGYFWHVQRRFSLRYMRDYGFGRRCETLESVFDSEVREMIDIGINGPNNDKEMEVVKDGKVYLPLYFSAPFINGMLQVFARTTFPRSEYPKLWELSKGGLVFQRSSDDVGRAITYTPWLKNVAPEWSGYNDLKRGNQYFIDLFRKLIKTAQESHSETHDRHFLDMYIRKIKEEMRESDKTTFSEDQLLLLCTDYMFPTATALGMVLAMLVERMLIQPEIQDRIHEEIDRVVGRDRVPTLDDRRNMPYTEACIREIMRVESIVPLGLPHRAMEDVKFNGYDIPEGTFIAANYHFLHMDKQIWTDPENFRPERFITDGQLDVSKDKSLPFGAGRRLCAGETYARQSMFQLFSAFMQTFQLSTDDGEPLKAPSERIPGIITTLPEFWVRVTPRS